MRKNAEARTSDSVLTDQAVLLRATCSCLSLGRATCQGGGRAQPLLCRRPRHKRPARCRERRRKVTTDHATGLCTAPAPRVTFVSCTGATGHAADDAHVDAPTLGEMASPEHGLCVWSMAISRHARTKRRHRVASPPSSLIMLQRWHLIHCPKSTLGTLCRWRGV